MEAEATAFAMELLMPTEWLLADLNKHGRFDIEGDSIVIKLAKKYGVSEQLMTIRIAEVLREERTTPSVSVIAREEDKAEKEDA
jgi:Zn-dependent peptidase ImmA (M78 family)